MAQERSPIAIDAYANGVATSIANHYHEQLPKGKRVYPECHDARVKVFFEMARWFTVRISPFPVLEDMFLAAIAHPHCVDDADARAQLDEADRELLQYYLKFANLRPNIHFTEVLSKLSDGIPDEDELLASRRNNALDNFVKTLSHAADAARESDTSTFGALAKGVGTVYALRVKDPEPQVVPRASIDRGFYDRVCGRELCPHELLEEFDSNEALIDEFVAYEREVFAGEFPTFLYARSAKHDPDNIRDGLLDAVIMYVFAMHIVCGPTYAMTFGAKHGDGVSRGTANGYSGIEPEIIAYVAVQVWYFYSSARKWSIQIDSFNLQTFHANIVELFADRSDPWVIETFENWNEYIIPKPRKVKPPKKRKRAGGSARSANPRETAGVDLARRQAAAAAAARSAPPPPLPPIQSPRPRPRRTSPVIDPALMRPAPPPPPDEIVSPLQRPAPLRTPPPGPTISRTGSTSGGPAPDNEEGADVGPRKKRRRTGPSGAAPVRKSARNKQ